MFFRQSEQEATDFPPERRRLVQYICLCFGGIPRSIGISSASAAVVQSLLTICHTKCVYDGTRLSTRLQKLLKRGTPDGLDVLQCTAVQFVLANDDSPQPFGKVVGGLAWSYPSK